MTKLSFAALGLALLAGACTTTKSEDILTSGIYADIDARTAGTGTTDVFATLYFGNPVNLDFVELTGGDKLVATNGTTQKTMTETNILNIVSHTAEFDTGNEGDMFEVALDRTVDAGAPSSVAILPAAFTVDPPPATASRAADFGLAWDTASDDPMEWSAEGDCIELAGAQIAGPSPAEVTIPANTFKLKQGVTQTTCDVTITVSRHLDGDLDAHYGKGGTIWGTQYRTVKFSSTP